MQTSVGGGDWAIDMLLTQTKLMAEALKRHKWWQSVCARLNSRWRWGDRVFECPPKGVFRIATTHVVDIETYANNGNNKKKAIFKYVYLWRIIEFRGDYPPQSYWHFQNPFKFMANDGYDFALTCSIVFGRLWFASLNRNREGWCAVAMPIFACRQANGSVQVSISP